MNKFLLLATTLCLAATCLQAQTETITMEKAGTPDSIVDARNVRYTTTALTVSVPINGKDFRHAERHVRREKLHDKD